MTNDERRLIIETLGEMRQLKGEMKEFRVHVIGRVEKLEKKDADRGKENLSVVSVVIAFLALVVSIVVKFFKFGGR